MSPSADSDEHVVIAVEIFCIELSGGIVYIGPALITELVAYLCQLTLDKFTALVVVIEDEFKTAYLLHQFIVVLVELILLQPGQTAQLHLEYRIGLCLSELECINKRDAGSVGVGRVAYDANHLIDVLRSMIRPSSICARS